MFDRKTGSGGGSVAGSGVLKKRGGGSVAKKGGGGLVAGSGVPKKSSSCILFGSVEGSASLRDQLNVNHVFVIIS